MARSPAAMSSVSRARSGARRVLAPSDRAPSTSARAVIDFEPGSRTVAVTGPDAVGAVQGRYAGAVRFGTRSVCGSFRWVATVDNAAFAGHTGLGTVMGMCGRYATSRSNVDLSALFEAADETDGLEPDYNVAPTDQVPVVRVSQPPAAGCSARPAGVWCRRGRPT